MDQSISRRDFLRTCAATMALAAGEKGHAMQAGTVFEGTYFAGEGDVEYLALLETARRMFAPDPELQSLPMLYTPVWNGFVEGPTWGAWWIQNSYGPTYCALPFLAEPYTTFLQNAQDLWFDQMGDGETPRPHREFDWVPPDGCLCDAASPGWFVAKQGDGRVDIHDWGMEFTAAGLLMQAELLLISRDARAIAHYLPKLERCADFIETRRDPRTDLFLAGPAGNLLAPSYAGWKQPDGSYEKAYLAGLSVTTIAALDRLIAVERLAGREAQAELYTQRRERARSGLPLLTTEEGYFLKSLDPDGTPHGVFGAERHGYFEAVVNHDAVCFRVADDAQAERIMAKMLAIPDLRPHDLIITNYPSLDDMYIEPDSWLWSFGTWVNGGHWSTCEARIMMAYSRLGRYQEARRSMQRLLGFAREFRMDNPLVEFGARVYQPREPINLTYDAFGIPAALVRGLFEYLYRADGVTLIPHIPPGITRLEQRFPIRLGEKQLYLSVNGSGPIRSVTVNGKPWDDFDEASVKLAHERLPQAARVEIKRGAAHPVVSPAPLPLPIYPLPVLPPADDPFWQAEWITAAFEGNQLPLRIGTDSQSGSRFVGDIAQVRIFAQALTAEEIAALAQGAGGLDQDDSLVAAWDFERQEGDTFATAAGGELAARALGAVETGGTPLGTAVRLRGDGYLETPHHPRLNLLQGFTLAAFIRPQAMAPGGGRILDKITVGRDDGYLLDTYPLHGLRLITWQGQLHYAGELTLNDWSHIAATFEPEGELALYLNGAEVARGPAQAPTGPTSFAQLPSLLEHLRLFYHAMEQAGRGNSYEAAHTRLAFELVETIRERQQRLAEGALTLLSPQSQRAADLSYIETAVRHCQGLVGTLDSYRDSEDEDKRAIAAIWAET